MGEFGRRKGTRVYGAPADEGWLCFLEWGSGHYPHAGGAPLAFHVQLTIIQIED